MVVRRVLVLVALSALVASGRAETLQLGEALDRAVAFHPDGLPPLLRSRLEALYQRSRGEMARLLADPGRRKRAAALREELGGGTPDRWRRPKDHLLALGENPEGAALWWNPRSSTVMVEIPAGRFRTGMVYAPETRPVRQRRMWGFLVDEREVTVERYREFLEETGHPPPRSWTWQVALPSRVVVDVTWEDARAYARWVGLRLPLPEEWERAALGDDGRLFPWGNRRPGPGQLPIGRGPAVEYDELSEFPREPGRTPVDRSPYGVVDVAVNVREWCQGLASAQWKVVKGGAFTDPVEGFPHLRTRRLRHPRKAAKDIGFRLVMPLPPGRLGGRARVDPGSDPRDQF